MLSGAILAGGHARRFGGRDKGLLSVDGRSVLARQLDALASVTDDILLVGRRFERPLHGVHTSVRCVSDRVPDCGPLGGLDAALAEAREAAVIVLACDMPFVTGALLAHLATLLGGADAVVPRTERGYHPLCAVYTRACREVVSRRLTGGNLALMALLDDLRVRAVPADELAVFGDPARLLANVNTPGEYADLVERDTHHTT